MQRTDHFGAYPMKPKFLNASMLRRLLFLTSRAALVVACGLGVATLADAGGGYIGIAVDYEARGGGKSLERGAVVEAIAPNSPAMHAGLLVGDLIAAADYTRIRSAEELQRYISSKNPNETVALVVVCDKGLTHTTSKVLVTLAAAPAVGSSTPADSALPSPDAHGSSPSRASEPAAAEFF